MAIQSDVVVNVSKFAPNAVSKKTEAMNEHLIDVQNSGPRWYQVGAAKYRKMRENGETPLPRPTMLDGDDIHLPSREPGRPIACRVMRPSKGEVKGVFMHIHGGGWVLMSERYSDPLLRFLADAANLAVISVGYRLAPEHPFPQGNEDCYDVAEWLVDNARAKFGGDLLFMGGESAGAHLTALTTFHLLATRPAFRLHGLNLVFGCYDLAGFTPTVHTLGATRPLVINHDIMAHYIDAYLPRTTEAQRRDPAVSPLYRDLRPDRGRLPPALFTVGTEDCLLDDSVLMGAKWAMSGAETVVKVYPGCPHGFVSFPPEAMDGVAECLQDMRVFLTEHL
ncbi:MAG: hypothetical protein M1821_009016 [Bathelium mastoideum]|nr:MAG: hypothetical protein M1821_009016 [Bathelium mastoideum]